VTNITQATVLEMVFSSIGIVENLTSSWFEYNSAAFLYLRAGGSAPRPRDGDRGGKAE